MCRWGMHPPHPPWIRHCLLGLYTADKYFSAQQFRRSQLLRSLSNCSLLLLHSFLTLPYLTPDHWHRKWTIRLRESRLTQWNTHDRLNRSTRSISGSTVYVAADEHDRIWTIPCDWRTSRDCIIVEIWVNAGAWPLASLPEIAIHKLKLLILTQQRSYNIVL